MKKLFLAFVLATVIAKLYAQNPVPNSSFESWTGSEPDSWVTSNAPPAYAVTQTINSHSGSLAARGDVLGSLPPILISTDSLGGTGFPVTQAYAKCTFWYENNLSGLDEFAAGILMYDNAGNVSGYGALNINTSANNYTEATVPIINFSGNPPAECIISFQITNPNGTTNPGSFFIVDDVALTDPLSAEEHSGGKTLPVIYPNPASENIYFNLPVTVNNDFEITLSDFTGRIVFEKKSIVELNGTLDIRNFSCGIYFFKAESGNNTYLQKIMISH